MGAAALATPHSTNAFASDARGYLALDAPADLAQAGCVASWPVSTSFHQSSSRTSHNLLRVVHLSRWPSDFAPGRQGTDALSCFEHCSIGGFARSHGSCLVELGEPLITGSRSHARKMTPDCRGTRRPCAFSSMVMPPWYCFSSYRTCASTASVACCPAAVLPYLFETRCNACCASGSFPSSNGPCAWYSAADASSSFAAFRVSVSDNPADYNDGRCHPDHHRLGISLKPFGEVIDRVVRSKRRCGSCASGLRHARGLLDVKTIRPRTIEGGIHHIESVFAGIIEWYHGEQGPQPDFAFDPLQFCHAKTRSQMWPSLSEMQPLR